MADSSYNPSVYKQQGGNKLVVASGGEIKVESGGSITNDGTQASNIADLAVTYTLNDPSITANSAITIADGDTPTVVELNEFCEELKSQIHAIIDVLEGAGLAASS